MRSTDRRYIQSAPLFVLLLACVAGKGSATGTTPQFTLQNAKGLRGGVARVPLDVSNGVGDTKAINFTIKILEGENLVDGLLKGSSELDGFEENSPSQTEYRAIIDPPSSTFSTLSSRRIATIEVPIKANPSGNTIMLEVVTKFDQDGIVGLTGMSDLNGNSVHGPDETPAPNGPRAILGNSATITLPDQSVGFCDSSLSPDWEFSRVLPVTPTVTPTPTPCLEGAPTQQGYGVTLKAKNTFGFLQTKDTDATVIPSPGDGKILHVLWTIGSNSALAYDLPTFRLRTSARDASFTQEHIFQEGSAANNAPIVMPVTGDGAPRNFESVYYCPTSLTNDLPNVSSNGIILAFDVLQFEEGTNGVPESRLYLMNVVYSTIDPTPLGNGTLVLDLDFSAGEQHDFTPIEFNPSTAPPPTPIPDPVHHCEYKGILPSKLTVTGSPEESGGLNIELLSPRSRALVYAGMLQESTLLTVFGRRPLVGAAPMSLGKLLLTASTGSISR
jgi:hypothetical protein